MNRLTKILSVMLVLVFVFCAIASGTSKKDNNKQSNNSAADDNGVVELVKSGYTVKETDYIYWSATIKNTSATNSFQFPKIVITAFDDNGNVIATEDQTLSYIAPNETIGFGNGQLSLNGKSPAKVDFSVKSGHKADANATIPSSQFEISNFSDNNDGSGGYTSFAGMVTNKSDKTCSGLSVQIILYKDGNIVGGDGTYLTDALAPNEQAPFDTHMYKNIEYDTIEVYAYPWL